MRAGDIIQDRYELRDPLGQGGMAYVWRALDRRLHRSVAIKFLAAQLSDEPEFLVRFFSEAQAVARVTHRHVVSILDFGQHEGRPYIVMEYVPGGSVADDVGEPMEPRHALTIVAQAAAGAGAAHARGVVHRDLKPPNLLKDERGAVKLADFGIASSPGDEKLTATGTTIGSPHYISPEQVSSREATPRSDVYSLGIVLYELLTGRRPFDGHSITSVAIAHVDREPDPPSAHADVAPEIDALVMRCLAKDAGQRFPDGGALARHIDALLRADAAAAGAGPDLHGGWRQSPRPALVGAAIVAVTALISFGAAQGPANLQQPATADPREPARQGEAASTKTPGPESSHELSVEPPSPPSPASTPRDQDDAKGDEQGDDDPRDDDKAEPEGQPSPSPPESSPKPEPDAEETAATEEAAEIPSPSPASEPTASTDAGAEGFEE